MRIFAALPVSEETAETLMDLQADLPGNLRHVAARDFHITLSFAEGVQGRVLDFIAEEIADLEFAPFAISFQDMDVFGEGDKLRNIHIMCPPNDSLIAVQKRVQKIFVDAGARVAHRRFVPHVTLARRSPGPVAAALTKWVIEKEKSAAPESIADQVVLFRSELSPDGPIYTEISRSKSALPDFSGWI